MLKFEVGQPLPLPMDPPGQEIAQATFNENFFDLVCWVPASETSLVPIWKASKLEYGLFVADNIPFFLINFPGKNWNFEVSLNIKKVMADKVEAWLNSEGNIIHLYLCDYRKKTLLAQRMISIKKELSEKLRDALENQDERYQDSREADKKIVDIMQSFTTAEMINKVNMIRL